VRAALRGFNPEGRVYAAHALLEREEIDPRDEAAISELRALSIDITICHGCLVTKTSFTRALDVLDE